MNHSKHYEIHKILWGGKQNVQHVSKNAVSIQVD